MAKFMCQLEWPTGYLDMGSNMILSVSTRMTLTFESVNSVKQIALTEVGGPRPINRRPG